ncbi:hypothetical protein BZA05DRAFT_423323 [Tricharina praecox]|uniref:uncharacterized protein n=1 Tax=Tricharina praecox TaxID=43433 RepID=UPI00221FC9AF|nr:uncharacterized protein BZA05DRAFT_423323 [Tricharina praecox]KAI5858713.1 hypothetical protein BZA05DRAFT_423323 [Tricharina praecox]
MAVVVVVVVETKALIIAVVFVSLVVVLFIGYMILRHCRKRQREPPRFLPETLRKRWREWNPGTYTSPGPTPRHPSTRNSARNRHLRNNAGGMGAGVDRNTSVRSVMTLPEYRPIAAADRERTIAREGERGGIDVVIEFPETIDEEENRREEHMQTLYEIRLARQLERAAARESGELSAAAAMGRPGSSGSSVRLVTPDPPVSAAQLMTALASITERERRLSKVQYAEIGVARHDGTRVRPSMDSDRPLLDAGAPMGNSGGSIRSTYAHGRSESGISYSSATPERRGSEEIIRMGSARPSTETHRESGPVADETRNRGIDTLPVLRVETNQTLPTLRIDTGTPSPGGMSRASFER